MSRSRSASAKRARSRPPSDTRPGPLQPNIAARWHEAAPSRQRRPNMQTAALVSGGTTRYLEEIRRFPMLEAEEESVLAKRWREQGDADAAHKLVTSHLRLVAKLAVGYRGYGLPISEVISEGNVGLMQAAERFDPQKGFRFATYAMWWIKAAIQEYILRSWSLVKMINTVYLQDVLSMRGVTTHSPTF